ncbi:beta/gamma crystallin-related protein [Rhodoferax saidenbachensis]|uniref:Uncharacterized protein YcfJ n=1 Tax=Rhodoferax saidenbachensis TaxID=1484693 RepID=A0ABU1ZJL7_9BURK|nr:beta/gamma crystallin-related protein [Rhodoferax saidenbachensis]MDR7305065.1 uncharacterized protein YcfJ [Rhodoferax saidenbachensis]
MTSFIPTVLAAALLAGAGHVGAQVVFYENQDFRGRAVTVNKQIDSFQREGFNDRATSAIVLNDRWEACDDVYFGGRCVVLRPGRYPSLAAMGMNDRISSVREVHRNARIDDNRYAPEAPQPVYDNRRRGHEKLYQAKVTSVRAVVGPPEQRCWMEREDVPATQGSMNVTGALAGALLGGILGHQVGSGGSRDLVTVGGAVAGGAIGANVGRDNKPATTREVQRCNTVPSQAKPEFWDVAYTFRGQEHHVQMTAPPRQNIPVNAKGEPRA